MPTVAPVTPVPNKGKEQEKPEKPKNKLIKLSRAGTFSKKAETSPAPSPALVSRQPSISIPTPRPAELERGDSISVQNRPVVKLTSAAPLATSLPTPEPPRSIVNTKAARPAKKRKLAETDSPAGPSRPHRKIVTMKYRKEKLSAKLQWLLRHTPSSTRGATPADSIIASARSVVSATPSLPRVMSPATNANIDTSKAPFTSTLGAGSSSQPVALQRTPLSNGKQRKPLPSIEQRKPLPFGEQRKPLPSGEQRKPLPGAGSGSSPARPTPTPRSVSQAQSNQTLAGSVSPGASRSSAEPGQAKHKIIKLRLGSKALIDAASGNGSASSSQAQSSVRPSPAPSQARASGEADKA